MVVWNQRWRRRCLDLGGEMSPIFTVLSLSPTKESWKSISFHYSPLCNWLTIYVLSSHLSHDLQVQILTVPGELPTDSNLTLIRTQSKPIIYFPQITPQFPFLMLALLVTQIITPGVIIHLVVKTFFWYYILTTLTDTWILKGN